MTKSSNLETQPAIEITVGLAQLPCAILERTHASAWTRPLEYKHQVSSDMFRTQLFVFCMFNVLCGGLVWKGLEAESWAGVVIAIWGAIGLWGLWRDPEIFFKD